MSDSLSPPLPLQGRCRSWSQNRPSAKDPALTCFVAGRLQTDKSDRRSAENLHRKIQGPLSHWTVPTRRTAVQRSIHHPPASAIPNSFRVAFTLALLAAPLTGCNDGSVAPAELAALVHTEVIQPRARHTPLTLTGEVEARFRADLSFRVSGRVLERLVDVGAPVNVGDLLARIDPTEQQADFAAATAAVAAAEAQLRVAQATFERQNYLLSSGFTTRTAHDQSQEQLRTAQSTLKSAKAELGTARDKLEDTQLRARAEGVITARKLEVGQIVQAAQTVFTVAQDGERDAVFDVPEIDVFRRRAARSRLPGTPLGSRCESHRVRQGDIACR